MVLTGVADWCQGQCVSSHQGIASAPRHSRKEWLHEVESRRNRQLPVQPLKKQHLPLLQQKKTYKSRNNFWRCNNVSPNKVV